MAREPKHAAKQVEKAQSFAGKGITPGSPIAVVTFVHKVQFSGTQMTSEGALSMESEQAKHIDRLDVHPMGVYVRTKDGGEFLVPFANVKNLKVAEE